MTAIQIDDNVPVPPPAVGGKHGGNIDAMRRMAIGQSFVYRPRNPDTSLEMQRNGVYRMARTQGLSGKFACRFVEENGKRVVRVWRVA